MIGQPLASSSSAAWLMPALGSDLDQGPVAGYLSITLDETGHVRVRGSRTMLAWILEQLAARGWRFDLEDISWCG